MYRLTGKFHLTQYLRTLSPPHLSFLLCPDVQTYSGVPPLSLLSYRMCILSMALRRQPVDLDDRQQMQNILNHLKVCHPRQHTKMVPQGAEDTEGDMPSLDLESCDPSSHLVDREEWRGVMKNGQWMELEHVYRKHVKPKKQHEIQKLSQTISHLCCQCRCSPVVDVGAGLGHLSRILTFAHGVKVTTVEAEGGHAPKAEQYDREIKKNIRKAKLKKEKLAVRESADEWSEPVGGLPSHIVSRIHAHISTRDFLALIKHNRHEQQTEQCREQTGSGSHLESPHMNQNESLKTVCANGTAYETNNERVDSDVSKNNFPHINTQDGDVAEMSTECLTPNKTNSCTCSPKKTTSDITKDITNENTMSKCEIHNRDSNQKHQVTMETDKSEEVEAEDLFVLDGLHACGDLTPTLIRMFINCEAAVGLASVGCCYMKLSVDVTGSSEGVAQQDIGYPMSQFVAGLPDAGLTYSSRELACHFADCYIQRLKDNPAHLKIHSYRAALQHVIQSVRPDFQNGLIKLTVRRATDLSFENYAKTALEKLGFTSDIPPEVLSVAESYLPLWKDVVVFYTLRLCLAPVVETLLLLDRMLYLLEHGVPSVLVPIFDPKLSPRNYVLLATKE
ncbi:probable methyltransferase-like protein 25 [Haliotis rubra]|uniref:probable methyltransferase-like protein 25 n=1 Tax=Haliotis rubra TaxID=36100 RepID=UPI001EE63566|nr:probable methyltransferase-like protein 25 [Haliotis rubra]